MVFADHLLMKYPSLSTETHIKIGSHCQSVVDNLENTSHIVSWNKHLYQVLRETKVICRRWNVSTGPTKTKAHQDDIKCRENLSSLEEFNVQCGLRAKC